MTKRHISFGLLLVNLSLAIMLGLGVFLTAPTDVHAQGLFPLSASALAAPELKLPENKSYIKDTTPYFKWKILPGAVRYQLVIDDNANFPSPILNNNLITNTWYTYLSPLPQGTYYWRVRGMNVKNVWGAWSYTFRFTVDTTPPGITELLSPANGASTTDHTPTFYWKPATGASRYIFSIDNNSNFSSPVFESPAIEATSYNMLFALPSGTYYWRVRSRDAAANWANWSVAWKIIIKN